MRRQQTGSMLGLIAACMSLLIVLGSAIFYMLQILGGGRQVTSATDAGCLNVARVATLAPSISLTDKTNPAVQTYPKQCEAAQSVLGPGKNVNLLNFNKLVLWSVMVAANAEADGGETAINDAKLVWKAIEGDTTNSIGAQLKKALVDPASSIVIPGGTSSDVPSGANWAANCFNAVALKNATAMANNSQQIEWKSLSTAYLGVGDSTNVPISIVNNLAPYKNLVTGEKLNIADKMPTVTGADGVTYVKGYVPIEFPKVGRFYFVTVYQDQNTSLRSDREYQAAIAAGAPGASDVALPPNTFFCSAQVTDARSKAVISAGAPACIGTKAYKPVGSSPTSLYIKVNNGSVLTYKGELPQLDNVTAQELSTGITSISLPDGGALFSNNGALENWLAHNSGSNGQASQPSLEGLFDQNGKPATAEQAAQAKGMPVTCTDLNSDGPTACALCRHLLVDPVGNNNLGAPLGAFDKAYYDNNASYGLVSTAPNLTADEYAAVDCASGYARGYDTTKLVDIYRTGTNPVNPHGDNWTDTFVLNLSAQSSGLRLFYPNYNPMLGASIPWIAPGMGIFGSFGGCSQEVLDRGHEYSHANYFGVVTKPGSIKDLVAQNTAGISTASGDVHGTSTPASSAVEYSRNGTVVTQAPPPGQQPVDEVTRLLTNRIYQIKPAASKDELDTILSTPLAPGYTYYIYAMQPSGKLTITTSPPPGVASGDPDADGVPVNFSTHFPLITPAENPCGNMINANYYGGIHGAMFMQIDSAAKKYESTHSITYKSGSGADNNLGSITFQNEIPDVSTPPPTFFSRN